MLQTFFMFCAIFGGSIVVIQFLLALFGVGFDSDVDFDTTDVDIPDSGVPDSVGHHDAAAGLFRVLSLRTALAGITFFGFGGWAMTSAGHHQLLATVVGILCGGIAVVAVYFLYRLISSMHNSGNISRESLLGATGSVYVRIPMNGKGVGKVLVTQQNRTMEYEAISLNKELQAGTQIVVTKVVSDNTVEVAPI